MFKMPNYQFGGDPVGVAAAAKTAAEHLKAAGQVGAAQAGAAGQMGAAQQNAVGQLYNQPGQIFGSGAGAGAQGFGGLAGGLGGIGNSLADLYGSYNTSLANLYSNQAAAMAQAEAARQLGLSNTTSAGLSAMGQMTSGAFGAQAQNQAAAYKAMADMLTANQQAMSSYGSSREGALAGLGNSAATLGGAGANAYSQLGVGTSAARANAAGALGAAYGNALGNLGQSASALGTGIANANAGLYGTLGTAAGGLGSATNSAMAPMFSRMSDNSLGGYNTAAKYRADMARLGLSRELGLGQIDVAQNAFAAPPGGNVNLTTGGQPMASGSFGGGGGGGGGVPSRRPSSDLPVWYESPQSLPDFADPTPRAAIRSIRGTTNDTLGSMGSYGNAGGRGIREAQRDSFNRLGALGSLASGIPGMNRDTSAAIDRDFSSAGDGIGSSMNSGFGGIDASRNAIVSSPIAQNLMDTAAAGRRRLNRSMNTNNELMTGWLDKGLGSLSGLLGGSYGQLNSGMDQFYGNIPRDGAQLMTDAIGTGAGQITGLGQQIGSAWGDLQKNLKAGANQAYGTINDMMDRTNVMTPLQRQQMQFDMDRTAAAERQRRIAEGARATAQARSDWFAANPYRPSGNAATDAINRSFYGIR